MLSLQELYQATGYEDIVDLNTVGVNSEGRATYLNYKGERVEVDYETVKRNKHYQYLRTVLRPDMKVLYKAPKVLFVKLGTQHFRFHAGVFTYLTEEHCKQLISRHKRRRKQ